MLWINIWHIDELFFLLGIRAGMFVREAKALCPDLVIFPYNFEAYEEVRSTSVSTIRCFKE